VSPEFQFVLGVDWSVVTGRPAHGLRNAIAFYFSEDLGKLLENLTFIELKRRGYEVYFYKGTRECDFLIKEKSKIIQAIQVTKDMDVNNRKREVDGLVEAMKIFNLKEGTILTQYQEDTIEREGGSVIHVVPLWKWLLPSE
jgi:predicted AAA+ superfamily ATPase